MNRRLLLCTFPLLLLTACFPKAGTAPGPLSTLALESARSRWPDASPDELEQGRQLFLANCNACHGYPDRVAYSEENWPDITRRMGDKVDLSPADTERVLRFILVSRSEQAAASP